MQPRLQEPCRRHQFCSWLLSWQPAVRDSFWLGSSCLLHRRRPRLQGSRSGLIPWAAHQLQTLLRHQQLSSGRLRLQAV